jgi:hypothetical protein
MAAATPPGDGRESRTDSLLAGGEAARAQAEQSIQANRVSLDQSRNYLAGANPGDLDERVRQVCRSVAEEMRAAGDSPTADQLSAWRERLHAAGRSP